MSTILDALRRAEAERGRGTVPGLHAQSVPAAGPTATAAGAGTARWRLPVLAAATGLAVLGAALWWLQPTPSLAPAADSSPALAPAVAPAVAATVPTVPMPSAPEPAPPAPPPPPSIAMAAAPVTAPLAATVPTTPAAAPIVAPAQASLPAPVPLAALTPDQRRQWPPLTIGGSVYSDNAASRFVIANGQIVREGEAAAPGVTVERIGPRGTVLRWGQLRVEVPL